MSRGPSLSNPVNHGTYGGYYAHKRRGTEPCPACKRALKIRGQVNYLRGKCAPGLGWPLLSKRETP